MDKNDARFKLVHVVMPRAWYAKVKEIRRSYRRRRPGKGAGAGAGAGDGDGDGAADYSGSASDRSTSFESCAPHSFDQAYPLRPIHNLKGYPPAMDWQHGGGGGGGGRGDGAGEGAAVALEKSLIDAAFPLSPKNFRLAPSALPFSLSPAATTYSMSTYSMSPSSPSSRFCPSPCRYPAPSSPRLHKGADIPFPASPRKTPLHHPSSASAAAAAAAAPASTFRLPPGQGPGPGPVLHRSRSEARPVRASLLACFSDDFRLAATKSDSEASSPSPPRHSQHSVAEAQAKEVAQARKSVTGSGTASGCGNSPPRPSAHRRSLSFSCMSNAGAAGDSPDSQQGRVSHLPLLDVVVSPPASSGLKCNAWERESVLLELDHQVVRKEVLMRKRSPVDKPSFRTSNVDEDVDAMLVRDRVKGSTEVDNCCSFRLSTSSGGGDGIAEPSAVLWEKGFSSATTSEDPETSFFTSIEADSACVTPRSLRPVPVPLPASFPAFPPGRGQAKCATRPEPWEASFIPEERELSCPSSDSGTDSDIDMPAVEFSEANSAWDTDDSTPVRSPGERSPSPISSPAPSRHMDQAVLVEDMEGGGSQDAEDYPSDQSLELEERGLKIRTLQHQARQPLQRNGHGWAEDQASPCSSSVSSTGAVCEDFRARELEQQIMSVSPRIRMWEPLSVASSHGCTTEEEEDMEVGRAGQGWEESLLAMRKCSFSSDDDHFVLNDLDADHGRHVVSPDESPERLEVHQPKANKARTGRREGGLDRRRSSRHIKAAVQARPRLGYAAMKKRQTHRGVKESHKTATAKQQGRRASSRWTATQMPPDIQGKVRESVPVVTRSYDPYGDFRDSMLEMIVEKEILDTPDLEELLQAYLALNSEEYHGLIVEVFTDLWYEIFESEESGF